jgi:WD40 repeat protein
VLIRICSWLFTPRKVDMPLGSVFTLHSSSARRKSLYRESIGRSFVALPRLVKLVVLVLACSALANTVPAQEDSETEVIVVRSHTYPNFEPADVDELGDPLPRHATIRFGTQRFQHPDSAIEMALSPDNKTIITYGQGGIIAWDTRTGKSLWKERLGDYPPTAYGVRALAFSSHNEFFYASGSPNTITRIDTQTGRRETLEISSELPLLPNNRPVSSLPGTIRSIDVTSDGNYLAAAGAHGIAVYDQTGRLQYEVANNPANSIEPPDMNRDRLWFGGHFCLAIFSGDGKSLAVAISENPKRLRTFSVPEGELQKEITLTDNLVRMAFSPDGESIVCTERDSAIRQYNLRNGKQQWETIIPLQNNAECYTSAIAYAPDGEQIAAGAAIGARNSIVLLQSNSGEVQAVMKGHSWKPWALAYSSDSRMLFSTGWEGTIRRWDTQTFKQLDPPQGLRGTPIVTAVPNGHLIAHADDLGSVHIVDIDGKLQRTLSVPEVGFTQLCFSQDGKLLAGGGPTDVDVTVIVWDVGSGSLKQRWSWPKGNDPHSAIESMAFSPDASRLAAAVFRQDTAYLWDVVSGKQIAAIPHKTIYGLSISPDNQTLATAGWDKRVNLWSLATGDPIRSAHMPDLLSDTGDLRMYHVCISPRNDLLVTAHLDGTVRLWSMDDFSLKRRFQVQGRFLHGAVCFSPEGQWLATGGADGTLTIWDVRTGESMWRAGKHENHVYTVSFADHGRKLVSGAADGLSYCWDLKPRVNEGRSVDQQWENLGQNADREAAYSATWTLLQMGESAVSEIESRLQPVRILINLDEVGKGLDENESQRRRQLTLQLVKKDSKVDFEVRIDRALVVLTKINSPASITLLNRLATQHPCKEIRDKASAELSNVQ